MSEEKSLAIGMAFVGIGDYLGAGVPAANFNKIPEISEGSVVFNFAEPTQVKVMIEGTDEPRWIVNRKGDIDSVEFAIPSPTAEEMKMFCGGTITGKKWEAPSSVPTINKSVKMNTEPYEGKYIEYIIVNGSVSARLSQAPSKEASELLLIKISKQAAVAADGTLKTPFTREAKAVEVVPPEEGA